jgi:transcriptional regulator with XRE-family HTH domain
MEDFNRIKEWLLSKLEERGQSVEQFSRQCGLSKAALYFYLSDKNRPSEANMRRICDALGCSLIEGLRQYTPKKNGRPKGLGGMRDVKTHGA